MKYILNKKLMYANIILCLLLVGYVTYLEGTDIFTKRYEKAECPANGSICEYISTEDGKIETFILLPGEKIERNKFNKNNLNIANYGVWILIFITLIINHFVFNKEYPIKKKIKEFFSKIEIED